jgi:hypothetical protein
MAETEKKTAAKQAVPKGGSKGGTRFPRLNMAQALGFSKKLVSKTFSGPQPETTILVGVFNNKGPHGEVRASALKQYGLMDGDRKGYVASDLAKKIEAVVPEEKAELIRKAFLTPKLFKQMYDTLQPDKVTRAKVRQAAATGGVHPDTLELCVDCFIEGASHAGLGAQTDDGIDFGQATLAPPPPPPDVDAEITDETQGETDATEDAANLPPAAGTGNGTLTPEKVVPPPPRTDKPAVTLALTVDATSDPDKLEKQLKLLRQYGVI